MKRRFRGASWTNPLGLKQKIRTKRKLWTWRRILRATLITLGVSLGSTILLFAWYAKDLPTPGKIRKYQPAQATQIFDRNGQPLYAVFDEEKRISIAGDKIPAIVKNATIAVEDKDFYKHHGISVRGVARAALNNILHTLHIKTSGYQVEGGSTITQQYVKLALLSSDRSFDRKIRELILSIELEFMFSKDQILTLYLNEIPYGSNAYGIESAAQTFYGKSATDLTLAEAATLAALPQRPSYLSPYGNHLDQLKNRKEFILKQMASQNLVTQDDAKKAIGQDVSFVPRHEQITAPHFVFYIRDQLIEKYGEQAVLEGGLKVTTTLDLKAQGAAEEAIKASAVKLDKYNADNAALAAVDPKTGQILAMVGSVDYFDQAHKGNFNVATASRQPGSSFKPIVYATAFKGKYSPSSTLWDVPTDFGNYTPQNFDGNFHGPVTIRTALANSFNVPAVKTLSLVGIPQAIKTAEELGITTLTQPDRYGLSLVLGGAEVKPVEMANAYAAFANLGVSHPLTGILKVEDSKGHVLEDWQDKPTNALAPEVAYEITHILIDNDARTPEFGAHSVLYFPDRPVAVKTGTTSEFRDSWTVGYTPSVSAAVWVGNNNNSPMDKAGGVKAAGPIFHDFIERYVGKNDPEPFTRPDHISEVTVDALSGKLPTDQSPQTITDIFAPWQVPTEHDDIHVTAKVNKLNGKLATDLTPPDLIETRTYSRIHSERPDNSNWEQAVLSWAKDHGFNLSDPPTDKDDYSVNQLPTINFLLPAAKTSVNGIFDITAQPQAAAGIRSVTFLIDGNLIGTRTNQPWSVSYDSKELVQGNHELTIEVTDGVGATAKATELVFALNTSLDSTPPGPVTQASAQTAGQPSGTAKLSWVNPTDSDLSKVRIYRSTTSGQLGSMVSEVAATPGANVSTSVSGLTPGVFYYFTLRPIDTNQNENQTTTQVSALAI